jgi:4'-phosphopantetheinyl transferase EntD
MLNKSTDNGIYWGVCKDVSPAEIHPAERALIESSQSHSYRNNFYRGRLAAKQALCLAGLKPTPPVLRGLSGEPLWPENFTGSISHSNYLAIAATALKQNYISIGIDCEPLNRPIRSDLAERILLPSERKALHDLPEHNKELCLRFFFSAKESTYKVLAPLLSTPMPGFKDVELKWLEPWTKLSARVAIGEKIFEYKIDCEIRYEHTITAIFFAADQQYCW